MIAMSVLGSLPAPAQEPKTSGTPMDLPSDLGTQTSLGTLRFRGAIELHCPDDLCGYSGLWVSPDGERLAAVEWGKWLTAKLGYDEHGNLAGLSDISQGLLRNEYGEYFTNDDDRDAEALDFDGRRFLVGFEKHDRILAYSDFESSAEPIGLPPAALANIPYNMGFSSIASLPGGKLIALPEATSDPDQPGTRAWLVDGKQQGALWLRPSDGVPVSLAAFPNGDLLLLELVPSTVGTGTRLSRIAASDIAIGHVMQAHDIASIAPPVPGARIEGASIRLGPKGETLIYLMAADHHSPLFLFELTE